MGLYGVHDFIKVGGRTAEAGGTEQKDLLGCKGGQKRCGVTVTGPLIGPKACIYNGSSQSFLSGWPEIEAVFLGQGTGHSLSQGPGVPGFAAEYNSVFHHMSSLSDVK